MSAEEKLAVLVKALDGGKTITVATALRAWVINPRTWAKWKSSGHTLFKAKGNSLFMARGKLFDCIDGCRITTN